MGFVHSKGLCFERHFLGGLISNMLQSFHYVWKIKTICTEEGFTVTNEGRSTRATEDDSRND